MAAKVIEVVGDGATIEEAIKNILEETSKNVKNIHGIEVQKFHAVVEDGKIVKYRVVTKVAFEVVH